MKERERINLVNELVRYCFGTSPFKQVTYEVIPVLCSNSIYSYDIRHFKPLSTAIYLQDAKFWQNKLSRLSNLDYEEKNNPIVDFHLHKIKNRTLNTSSILAHGKTKQLYFIFIIQESSNHNCPFLDVIVDENRSNHKLNLQIIEEPLELCSNILFYNRIDYIKIANSQFAKLAKSPKNDGL